MISNKKVKSNPRNARNWIVTINSCLPNEEFEKGKMHCLFGVGQAEKGLESGIVHLQAVFNFHQPVPLSKLKQIWPKGHFEIVKDMGASIAYCQKDDTRIDGPWTFGTSPLVR